MILRPRETPGPHALGPASSRVPPRLFAAGKIAYAKVRASPPDQHRRCGRASRAAILADAARLTGEHVATILRTATVGPSARTTRARGA